MKPLTLLRALLLASLAGLLGLTLYSYRMAIDHAGEVAYGRDLRQLKLLDQRLTGSH